MRLEAWLGLTHLHRGSQASGTRSMRCGVAGSARQTCLLCPIFAREPLDNSLVERAVAHKQGRRQERGFVDEACKVDNGDRVYADERGAGHVEPAGGSHVEVVGEPAFQIAHGL